MILTFRNSSHTGHIDVAPRRLLEAGGRGRLPPSLTSPLPRGHYSGPLLDVGRGRARTPGLPLHCVPRHWKYEENLIDMF